MQRIKRDRVETPPRESEPATGGRSAPWIPWLIVAFSVCFAFAMFRGLEYHSGYHGNAYQAIHPESFSSDPFMSPHRPTMQSLLYLLVRSIGDLWLDDRFTFFVFVLIGVASLIGLDKTVRLFGAQLPYERAAILALMMLEHKFLDNHALLIDNYEFNPTTMAAPIIVWLLYHSLKGGRPLTVLSLMTFAMLVSVKNAWLPALFALTVLWKERLGSRGKLLAVGLVLGAIALGLAHYYLQMRPGDGTDVKFFDYLVTSMDNSEANPFLNSWTGNVVFVGMCLVGLTLRGLPVPVLRRIRLTAGLALAVWLGGGLYYSWAPDAVKIPYLVPFDVTRALWWPQYVLFVAVGVRLLAWMARARSLPIFVLGVVLWTALLISHAQFRVNLLAVVGLTTVLLFWWSLKRSPELAVARTGSASPGRIRALGPTERLRVVAVAACMGALSLYGVGTLHHRRAALAHLIRYGVMGDNGTAKWVGVNAYVREHIPPSALIVALAVQHTSGADVGLGYDGSLRTRTGRSMPLGHPAAFYLDYSQLQWWAAQVKRTDALVHAWERHDAREVAVNLSALGSPDYLVVSADRAQWLHERPAFPYTLETVVGGFAILRRSSRG